MVPIIDDCRVDSRGEYISSKGRAPQRSELEIAKEWIDHSGRAIIDARIRRAVFKDCDGPLAYQSEYWFFRESTGRVRPGTGDRAGPVMPLDFVDVPADGQDVALFLMAGYDAGGYALLFDNFRQVGTAAR
jgi:hypothetical protein